MQAAREYGDDTPRLWGSYLRPLAPATDAGEPWTLVSTRDWANGVAAFEAFRPRRHIENDAYRELKEGVGTGRKTLWGRDIAVRQSLLPRLRSIPQAQPP